MDDEMKNIAGKALGKCLGLKENEQTLIITDECCQEIGEAFYKATEEKTEERYLLKVKEQKQGELKAPQLAEYLMKKAPDVIIIPTRNSYTHMKAREKATEKGARVATLPGITKEIFKRTIDIDYDKLRKAGEELKKTLEKTKKIRIKTNSGTSLNLEIGHQIIIDDGRITDPGSYGNLPTGEVFTAPAEEKTHGKLVIDSMQEIAKPKTKVLIQNGRAQEVDGDQKFKEKLWSYDNGRNIAEFGIGLNPSATITGNILEDEKAKGTCHIAFGKNTSFGGKTDSEIHWDSILLQPDIWADEDKIMDHGKLTI